MKVYAIRDAELSKSRDLAWLLYYEKSDRFCIELCKDADEWDLPPILSSYAARGMQTVDFKWSMIWAEQRIVPPDRQNLGMILREHGLKEYNIHDLLMIAGGRCAQDECFLTPLRERDYPAELKERMRSKIRDLIHVSDTRSLLLLKDGSILEMEQTHPALKQTRYQRLLRYHQSLAGCRVSPGGQGIEWNEHEYIPQSDLARSCHPARVTGEDLRIFVQNNLVNTGEAADLLKCSRQNIRDLIRRNKLQPVREEKNNSMFLRSDILARLTD